MCNPASFAITKTGRCLWSKKTDSHSEIIAENSLREDRRGSSGDPKDTLFVKVEITPPQHEHGYPDFAAPLSKWIYRLDEDRAPEWYDAKKVESIARVALKDWTKAKVHTTGPRVIVDGETVFMCGGSALVEGGTLALLSGGTVSAISGGTVSAIRGGTVSEISGGTVSAIWGGLCATYSTAAKVVIPADTKGIVVDYTTTPPSIYGAHQKGR